MFLTTFFLSHWVSARRSCPSLPSGSAKATEATDWCPATRIKQRKKSKNEVTERFIKHFWAFVCHAILNIPIKEVHETVFSHT